jgi:hypothetical protein
MAPRLEKSFKYLTILVQLSISRHMNRTTLSERIKQAAEAGDFKSVQRLGALADRIEQIGQNEAALAREREALQRELNGEREIPGGAPFLQPIAQNGGRQSYSRGNLLVEIDLPRAGKLRISERTAADTMVVLMEHLLTSLGLGALEKLQQFRTGRGPLISRDPSRDFRNSKRDEIYGHRKIPGTDLYVITHSSTSEKVARLKEALRYLGLPPGSYRIAKTE